MTKVIRLPEVRERTGRSASSIYADIQTGDFPAQIKLGPRSVGWLESDIDEWIQQRVDESRRVSA